ncbi:hypothetical protein, partial [Chitinophaga varians]|uniref:hypothetical protein n=1 Tax=Chitinophaga varians TaxID=2202339 RepID=UPI00165FF12F
GTYDFILTVQDGSNAGCTKDVPFSVQIDANPTVQITAVPDQICKGATTTLSIGNSNNGYKIRWTLDGVAIPGTDDKVSITHTPTVIGNNTYKVTVTNGVCEVSDDQVVIVRSMPTATVTNKA